MPIAAIIGWLSVGETLITAGLATAAQIRTFIQSIHPGLSEDDLNAILDGIISGATRHKRLADGDAGH